MRRRTFGPFSLCAALAIALPAALRAQAPAITPAGDPSVRSDTIYALAVDTKAIPKDFAKYNYVMLLDDGVSRVDADGRGTRSFRQVAQILKQNAVNGFAERSFTYNPERETLRINWMRVLKPSGEVISEKPTMSQTSDVPTAMSNPLYQNIKVQRYSLSGIEAGSIVDISWTMEQKAPYLAGDFYEGWNVSMPVPVRRSRFLLDVPVSMTPHMVEDHLDFSKRVTEAGGRRVYLWARKDVTPPRGQMFAPDTSIGAMSVRVAAPIAWSDIGRWYGGLTHDRYTLGARGTAKVDSIVRGAHSRADTLRALHHWIAKDLRYVGIELGVGGYQPRMPDSVVATGFGDCKDKTTLFIAAAHHLGIAAFPVLLNAGGVRDTMLAAIEQFNHAIAAVPDRAAPSGYLFTDLTTDLIPPTASPTPYRDKLMLVVLPDGTSREITLPKRNAGASATEQMVAEIATDGTVSGRVSSAANGAAGSTLAMLAHVLTDSTARANMTRGMARSFFPNAKGDTLIVPDSSVDVSDTLAVRSIELRFHGGEGAKAAGSLMLLQVPAEFRSSQRGFANVVERIEDPSTQETEEPRRLPIDAGKLPGHIPLVTEVTITLPEGWKAQLPRNVSATSRFGTYVRQYAQNGRQLTITGRLASVDRVFPKEDFAELLTWMKAIAADKTDYIVLETAH